MLAENHLSSQDDIVRQLMSIRTLYERKFGKEVRGPADPDGAAEPQLSGSDDSRGQQTTSAPSQRQAPAQSLFARGCQFLHDETPSVMPLTQGPEPWTGKAQSRQQDRLGDLPSSSSQAPQGASGGRLWSALNKSTAAAASEAGKQRQQHEAYLQANIDQIQAQNHAVAAEQHAGGVSGLPIPGQPVKSREEVDADFAAVVLKERAEFQKVQPALQKSMLLRRYRALQQKLYDVRRLMFCLAKMPHDYYGGFHRQAL